jgi:hypothetical protein
MDKKFPTTAGCLGALILFPILGVSSAEAQSVPMAADSPTPTLGSPTVSDSSESGSESSAPDLRVHAGGRAGFGGSRETGDGTDSVKTDLATTYGGQFGLDYGLHRFFSLGGEMRLARVMTDAEQDADSDGDYFIDVVAKPKARYGLLPGLELYAAVPVGMTFVNLDDRAVDAADDMGVDLSAGPGFNLGLAGGSSYFFTDTFGLNAEAAYLMTWYGVDATVDNATVSSENSLAQLTLMVNATAAF